MRRIVVVGTSGSGKTTLARELSARLNLPCVELDELHWGPNWTPHTDFERRVQSVLQSDAWVIDGNYRKVRPMIWSAADAIVWLDYPMTVTLPRVFRRTFARWWRSDVLWEGNREKLWDQFCTRDSLFLWSIEMWRMHRRDYPKLLRNHQQQGKRIVRLCTPQHAKAWLDAIA